MMPSRQTDSPTMSDSSEVTYDINIAYKNPDETVVRKATYPGYLPTWEPVSFPPLQPFEFSDPALRVTDKSLPNLLGRSGSGKLTDIQPWLGTVVSGVQLSKLSRRGKDELASLVARRKVVAFPEQDLIDAGLDAQEDFMKHFGKLNYQPVSGSIKGHPAFHVIHRDGNKDEIARFFASKPTSCLWHQDVSYEIQPPGYVMLGLLEGPAVGGDSVFAAADLAYKRLSKPMQEFFDTVQVIHSSENMISKTRALGGLVRKEPVRTIHPLVRIHPVTGQKSLFINREFVTGFVGFKDNETQLLLDFLMNHLVTGHDFQARVKWAPKTIVIFDNRSTIHTASVDYIDEEGRAMPRHIFRLAAMAEKPIPVKTAQGKVEDNRHIDAELRKPESSF